MFETKALTQRFFHNNNNLKWRKKTFRHIRHSFFDYFLSQFVRSILASVAVNVIMVYIVHFFHLRKYCFEQLNSLTPSLFVCIIIIVRRVVKLFAYVKKRFKHTHIQAIIRFSCSAMPFLLLSASHPLLEQGVLTVFIRTFELCADLMPRSPATQSSYFGIWRSR